MLTLGKGAGSNPGSSSLCKKENSSCQALEETRAILYQPCPMALFENSPASLLPGSQCGGANQNRRPTCCCAKGLGWALPGHSQARVWVLFSHERQHNCPGPTQLSLEWVTGSPAPLGHCLRTSASAQAMHQTPCNQEATGLDFTGVSADPNMIPPQLKQLCETVLLLLQPGYLARYPSDVCKAFPPLWAVLADWKSQRAQEKICPQCFPILRQNTEPTRITL